MYTVCIYTHRHSRPHRSTQAETTALSQTHAELTAWSLPLVQSTLNRHTHTLHTNVNPLAAGLRHMVCAVTSSGSSCLSLTLMSAHTHVHTRPAPPTPETHQQGSQSIPIPTVPPVLRLDTWFLWGQAYMRASLSEAHPPPGHSPGSPSGRAAHSLVITHGNMYLFWLLLWTHGPWPTVHSCAHMGQVSLPRNQKWKSERKHDGPCPLGTSPQAHWSAPAHTSPAPCTRFPLCFLMLTPPQTTLIPTSPSFGSSPTHPHNKPCATHRTPWNVPHTWAVTTQFVVRHGEPPWTHGAGCPLAPRVQASWGWPGGCWGFWLWCWHPPQWCLWDPPWEWWHYLTCCCSSLPLCVPCVETSFLPHIT